MTIFFDIETIPGQTPEVSKSIIDEIEQNKDKIKAPVFYKKQETIDAYIERERVKLDDSFRDRFLKCSFSGVRGEIISIAFAIDGGQVHARCREQGQSERELLTWFFSSRTFRYYETWCGHNVRSFDLRFIWHRAVILGINPMVEIPCNSGPSDTRVFDTMTEWAGWGNRISLDDLCKALGLPGKDGFDGSMVYDAWIAGEYQKIAEYNISDVEKVRSVYNRMTFKSSDL